MSLSENVYHVLDLKKFKALYDGDTITTFEYVGEAIAVYVDFMPRFLKYGRDIYAISAVVIEDENNEEYPFIYKQKECDFEDCCIGAAKQATEEWLNRNAIDNEQYQEFISLFVDLFSEQHYKMVLDLFHVKR